MADYSELASLPDTHVVAALASGAHAQALSAFFGESDYAQLAKLARRAAKQRAPRKGRVYILPGIMGSTLGCKQKDAMRPIWLHPHAIARGDLLAMTLPARSTIQPTGVMLQGYLKIKLHLQAAGFDAAFHPFDWRKSVLDAGNALAQRIAQDGFKKVHVVAHSMGGLVARAALARDTKRRIARVVQLGAPNFGSFALVQALRGVYPTVRKVSALDTAHSTDQLVRHVFRTLPGLYEMLPAPARTTELDVTQLDNWPQDLLGPDATLLRSAVRMRARLGSARDGCFHIVGVDQETVTRARLRNNEFQYGISRDGDGTVPRLLAEWPGADTYYAQEHHGKLMQNDTVCRTVIDLLSRGVSKQLERDFVPNVQAMRWISDSQLRRGRVGGKRGKVRWDTLPLEERRRILEPVISEQFAALAS